MEESRIKFEKSGANKGSVIDYDGDFSTCNKFGKNSCELEKCIKLKIFPVLSSKTTKLRKECAELIKKDKSTE